MRSHETQSLVSRCCGVSRSTRLSLAGGDKLAAVVASLHGIAQVPIRQLPLALLHDLSTRSVNPFRLDMTKGMQLKAVELEVVELR